MQQPMSNQPWRRNGNPMRGRHRQAHLAQLRGTIAASARMPLSQAERDDLCQMREEEKIARDVYLTLFERWPLPPFGNISGSEQVHMDAMLALLEKHGLQDPARGLEIGEFRDPKMQALYAQLVAQGLNSPEDAIRVGLLIEELDIADLRAASQRTDKPEILAVYADLERGSRNHLRAFHRWMQRLNVSYAPAHLAREDFIAIAESGHENCH
jgi:hypothetical protein